MPSLNSSPGPRTFDPASGGVTKARRRVDRLARTLLPYPRDVALGVLLRSVRDLVLGRRPRTLILAEKAVRYESLWRAQRSKDLLSRGDPFGAAAEALEIERIDPQNKIAPGLGMAASWTEAIRGRATNRLDHRDVADAQDQLRAEGHVRPVIMLYHQVSPESPFQPLLYRQAWAHGIAPIPLHDLADLPAAEAAIAPETARVLHLHWVNRILSPAADASDARRRIDVMTSTLDNILKDHWSIVWTVHNILPHDSLLPEEEAVLRQAIADRAALIHIMARSTIELAAPWFRIRPERSVHVPLPSFRGAYPDFIDRSAARFALGLEGDARVITVVGGLRPYKGLDILLDAFDVAVRDHPDLRLLIAGAPNRSPEITAFLERARAHPRVHLHARMVSSDDLQLYLRAADAAVLPYVRTLNSAFMKLALAFDLPVIAPDLGGIPEYVDPSVATVFPAGDVDALSAALGAVQTVSPAMVATARRISEAHDADLISGKLMAAIRRAIDDGVPITTDRT